MCSDYSVTLGEHRWLHQEKVLIVQQQGTNWL